MVCHPSYCVLNLAYAEAHEAVNAEMRGDVETSAL